MSILVQKFGGTSVEDVASLKRVAQIVWEAHQAGNQVVVVVSAMGQETDRLLRLAREITPRVPDREYATLLATGEQVSAALLTMALQALGLSARSLQGFQLPIMTSNDYRQAHIDRVELSVLTDCLSAGIVPVVTGFQGVNPQYEVTTLGRGGSDVTAVAIAAALHATECQIYTDVAGVYTADPHCVSHARLINAMSYDEMLTFATLGAAVLQDRSVEMARKYQLPLRVLSSMAPGKGTLLRPVDAVVTRPVVSGIACVSAQTQLIFSKKPDAELQTALAAAGIAVEMAHEMALVIPSEVYSRLPDWVAPLHVLTDLARVSLVGVGMAHHAGLSAQIFQLLAQADIPIHAISSSAFQVTILIESAHSVLSMNLLHQVFILEKEDIKASLDLS